MPLRRLIRHSALLVLASAALVACGGDDGYPSEARTNFIESCDKQPNATRSVCECALDELERTLPYEDFKAADDAIRAGDRPKADVSTKLTAAVEGCVES